MRLKNVLQANKLAKQVIEASVLVSGFNQHELLGPCKKKPLANTRSVCFYILHELGLSAGQIGNTFMRNESSVRTMLETLEFQIKQYDDLRQIYEAVKQNMGIHQQAGPSHATEPARAEGDGGQGGGA